jgi:hypothetical protein
MAVRRGRTPSAAISPAAVDGTTLQSSQTTQPPLFDAPAASTVGGWPAARRYGGVAAWLRRCVAAASG